MRTVFMLAVTILTPHSFLALLWQCINMVFASRNLLYCFKSSLLSSQISSPLLHNMVHCTGKKIMQQSSMFITTEIAPHGTVAIQGAIHRLQRKQIRVFQRNTSMTELECGKRGAGGLGRKSGVKSLLGQQEQWVALGIYTHQFWFDEESKGGWS